MLYAMETNSLQILYIKPTDTHQYLEFLSCHVYCSKKFIPCSQALHLIGFIQQIGFSIINVINLSARLKTADLKD